MRPNVLLLCVVMVLVFVGSCAADEAKEKEGRTPFVPFCSATPQSRKLCVTCPFCRANRWSPRCLSPSMLSAYVAATTNTDVTSVMQCLQSGLRRDVIGQENAIEQLTSVIHSKLSNPNNALIMHFAGDHGVGKTTIAQIVGQALSLHDHAICKPQSPCHLGNAVLEISGDEYGSVPDDELGATVSALEDHIATHLRKFPDGMILLEDIIAMSPNVVRRLKPLFGQVSTFRRHPDVSLARATVVVTSDFGIEGRTAGMTQQQLSNHIFEETTKFFGDELVGNLLLVPFAPFSAEMYRDAATKMVETLPCRIRQVVCVTFTPAVAELVAANVVSHGNTKKNGREVKDVVYDKVDSVVHRKILTRGVDTEVLVKVFVGADSSIQVSVVDALLEDEL